MNIQLKKAGINDSGQIHSMQISSFAYLLEKYQDYDLSPGAEKVDRIIERMEKKGTEYYCVSVGAVVIGAVGVERQSDQCCRIAPIFILPEHQGHGYAKQVLNAVEELYSEVSCWKLDTIKEESSLCHLYESVGYVATGEEKIIKSGMTIIYYQKNK